MLDGTVWAYRTLSDCLTRASARAMVPRLHIANWRQISTVICKEQFTAKELANCNLEGNLEPEDELGRAGWP